MKNKILIFVSILIIIFCAIFIYRYFKNGPKTFINIQGSMSEVKAIETIKSKYPELKEYPTDKLAPKTIKTEKATDGWYIAFIQEGSGVPVISAECFWVKNDDSVIEIKYIPQDKIINGEFSAKECRIIERVLGGDKDEHGCIGSAGYSWCAVKNKCLRPWEEKCAVGNNDGNSNQTLRKEGQTCGENIGNCEAELECAYPCGIQGCQNVCMSKEDAFSRP